MVQRAYSGKQSSILDFPANTFSASMSCLFRNNMTDIVRNHLKNKSTHRKQCQETFRCVEEQNRIDGEVLEENKERVIVIKNTHYVAQLVQRWTFFIYCVIHKGFAHYHHSFCSYFTTLEDPLQLCLHCKSCLSREEEEQ